MIDGCSRAGFTKWLIELRSELGQRRKRRNQEGQGVFLGVEAATPEQEHTVALNDLQPALHDEVNRLPEKYRLPIILTYLEGKSNEEVAELLEWPVGTVKGRLFRARNLLRSRLTAPGIGVVDVLPVRGSLQREVEGAVIPDALIDKTVRKALRARFADSASALAPVEIGSPALPSGLTGVVEEVMPALEVQGRRKRRREFLFFLVTLLALGFAVYSYISTNPFLMALFKRRFMWLAFWQAAKDC